MFFYLSGVQNLKMWGRLCPRDPGVTSGASVTRLVGKLRPRASTGGGGRSAPSGSGSGNMAAGGGSMLKKLTSKPKLKTTTKGVNQYNHKEGEKAAKSIKWQIFRVHKE